MGRVSSPAEPAPTAEVPHLPHVPNGRVRWWTASCTVALAALLSLGAYAGTWLLVAAALLVTAVLALGWPALLALPSPRGTTAVVAVGAALAVLAVGLARDEPLLQWLPLALAAAVIAEFVRQLGRRDGRLRVVESSTVAVVGVALAASMSTWTALPLTPSGAGGVLVCALPVALALALQLLPVPARPAGGIGVVAALLLGALLGGVLDGSTVVAGAVAGLLGAGVAVLVHRMLSV